MFMMFLIGSSHQNDIPQSNYLKGQPKPHSKHTKKNIILPMSKKKPLNHTKVTHAPNHALLYVHQQPHCHIFQTNNKQIASLNKHMEHLKYGSFETSENLNLTTNTNCIIYAATDILSTKDEPQLYNIPFYFLCTQGFLSKISRRTRV